MGAFGGFEWVLIILVILLFFGAKRLPGLARGIGQGIREFRKARIGSVEDKSEREIE